MATTLESVTGLGSTDTPFRDFCTKVDTNIQAFGWTHTADTGQITPASVTHPSANADAGYRVYSTADGFTTWYLKLTFGLDSNSKMRLKVLLGTVTDGAGALSGNTSGTLTVAGSLPAGSTNLAMSGDTYRLTIVCGTLTNGTNNTSWGVAIDRTVDTSGAPSDDGLEVFVRTSDGVDAKQLFVPPTGTVPSAETTGWAAVFTQAVTAIVGANTRTGHPVTWGESITNNPTLAVLLWAVNDFTPSTASTITVSLYSASHTYLLDADRANQSVGMNSHNNRAAWRYE